VLQFTTATHQLIARLPLVNWWILIVGIIFLQFLEHFLRLQTHKFTTNIFFCVHQLLELPEFLGHVPREAVEEELKGD
jgi:hypothetical protein